MMWPGRRVKDIASMPTLPLPKTPPPQIEGSKGRSWRLYIFIMRMYCIKLR